MRKQVIFTVLIATLLLGIVSSQTNRVQLSQISKTGATTGQAITYNGSSVVWGAPNAIATPAGSNTQVQFNNAGATGASANLTYSSADNRTSLLGTNPTLEIASGANPSVPAASRAYLYAQDIATQTNLVRALPVGANIPLQDAHAFKQFATVRPGNGAALTSLGTGFTNVGTIVTSGALATTPLSNSLRWTTFTSSATAGTLASHRQVYGLVWRGNAAGMGGFRFVLRIGLNGAPNAGVRGFFGLSSGLGTPTNVDPTTSTTNNQIGLAFATNTGNWQFINQTTGSVPTVLDLGASFAIDASSMLELVLYAAPNASTVGYQIKIFGTTTVPVATTSGTLSTNLPSNAAFLAPLLWMTNNATALSAAFRLFQWTLESDY
jgi:hypothetical protein